VTLLNGNEAIEPFGSGNGIIVDHRYGAQVRIEIEGRRPTGI
jgi:hypothetical protein